MNSMMWFIYLASTVAGVAETLAVILSVLGGVGAIFYFFYITVAVSDGAPPLDKVVSKSIIGMIVGAVLFSLVPSERVFYMLAAAKGAEVVMETPEAQAIFTDVTEIIQDKLESYKNKD